MQRRRDRPSSRPPSERCHRRSRRTVRCHRRRSAASTRRFAGRTGGHRRSASVGAARGGATRRVARWSDLAVRPRMARFGPGYALARLIATPLYRLLWRVRVEGGEQLPRRGPAILAANHVSFFDSVVLIMTVRRTLSFVGKVEYLDSWKTRRLLPAFGMIPVDRSDGRRAVASLKIASAVLRAAEDVRHLPGRHPLSRRRPAHRPHRRGLPLDGHGRTDPAYGHRRDGPHPPPGTRVPRRSAGSRFGSATRSTQRTMPAAAATVDG